MGDFDAWNVWWSIYDNSVERFAEVKAAVDAAVPEGRSVDATAAVLVTLAGGTGRLMGETYDAPVTTVAPDDLGAHIRGLADAGATHLQLVLDPITTDTIQVTDAYMNKVVPEIMGQSPEVADQGDPLKNYVWINRELRKKNAATLIDLAHKSEPQFLWTGPFMPMRNAKITAAFAQRRTYIYNGKPIDQEDHLGFDMASVTSRDW